MIGGVNLRPDGPTDRPNWARPHALSVLLQIAVVNVSVLNTAFRTVPLALDQWLVATAMASAVLWAGELRKLLERAARAAPASPGAS